MPARSFPRRELNDVEAAGFLDLQHATDEARGAWRASVEAPLMAVIAFDIDGTLLDVDEGTDYEDPASVRRGARPNAQSVARVVELAERGHKVAYVTGRCHHLRAVTITQLLVKAKLPPGELRTQAKWEGYPAMATYKARALEELGASAYVGDHDADRQAARLAGIPFFHVDEFRAGALIGYDPSRCEHGIPYVVNRKIPTCGDCGRP